MKFYKNNKGMSLVSVMVAIGLTGVLSVILMKLSEQQANIQKKAQVDNDINEAIMHFRSVIMKKDSCNASFQGLKLGDSLSEIRYNYKIDQEPFAEVSKETDPNKAVKFRNSKIILREMKILTKNEIENAKLKFDPAVIMLKVTFEKPSGTLGGKTTGEIFEIPASVGKGDLVSGDDQKIAYDKCISSGGKIADWDTLEIFETEADALSKGVVNQGDLWFGLCVKEGRNSSEDMILQCITF